MSAEQRGPSVCNFLYNQEGKDEMTKASVNLQDLRRRIYLKAKAEKSWRFWGLYVHVCKMETLREAYTLAKQNDGAPGVDGVTFEAIETQGVDGFLEQIRDELSQRNYVPLPARKQEIPKDGGKVPRSFDSGDSGSGGARGAQAPYWSRSSRQTSNRDRLDIVPSGQLMTRLIVWPERSFSRKHVS